MIAHSKANVPQTKLNVVATDLSEAHKKAVAHLSSMTKEAGDNVEVVSVALLCPIDLE